VLKIVIFCMALADWPVFCQRHVSEQAVGPSVAHLACTFRAYFEEGCWRNW
jgi:hypothetical protein